MYLAKHGEHCQMSIVLSVRGCIGGASHWRSCEDYPLAPDRAWPNATAPGQSLLQLDTGTLPPHSQGAYLTQTIHFHTGYGYVAIESAVGFLARVNPSRNTLSSTNLLTSPSFSAHLVTPRLRRPHPHLLPRAPLSPVNRSSRRCQSPPFPSRQIAHPRPLAP
jgi:hypothetical protein